MTAAGSWAPRRQGLLRAVRATREPRPRDPFSLPVNARIGGDLVVIGHLALGRWSELYQVWSAREWSALTCKILAPAHRGERTPTAALRRERRVLRRLDHPNVLRYHRAGEEEGRPYVVADFVDGPSLLEVLAGAPRRRLPPEDAVRLAIHVGAALYHIHRRGLLYLDLKPANLVLAHRVPVLVDFDAVRPLRPARRPRRMLGTAPYMAPELALHHAPDARTDVYSLGALLYEMTTGRWPFEDVFAGRELRSGLEADYPQTGPSPPPSPGRFHEAVPKSLEHLILRCLARDPADRYPGMHPLLLALSAELSGPAALWPDGVRAERRRSAREE